MTTLTTAQWTKEAHEELQDATTLDDLVALAFRMIHPMPKPITWVCGPISNGGVGSMKGNLKVFAATIRHLESQGHAVFDQLPFGPKLNECSGFNKEEFGQGEKTKLLEGFYRPIFESDVIETLHFIPGWDSSEGASWEHGEAERLGLRIVYLKETYGA